MIKYNADYPLDSHDIMGVVDYAESILNVNAIKIKDVTYSLVSISEVGSFMWGMGNESDEEKGISDHDIIVIYKVDTKSILRGVNYEKNLPCIHDKLINGKRFDFSFMEVGHITNLLIKGNINAIWSITSPLIYYDDTSSYHEMCDFVNLHINEFNIFPSGLGMTLSQIADSKKRAFKRSSQKHLNGAYRTLQWMYNIISTAKLIYEPVLHNASIDDCNDMLHIIRSIRSHCNYNDIGNYYNNVIENKLREYLYDIRKVDL